MLSDSKEHPPSSLLVTNERSGSAVKCWDAQHSYALKPLLFRSFAHVHALILHVCMATEGVELLSTVKLLKRLPRNLSQSQFHLKPFYLQCFVFNELFGPAAKSKSIYARLGRS